MTPYIPGWIKRYSDAKLDKEIFFAEKSLTENDPSTYEWRDVLIAERGRRTR